MAEKGLLTTRILESPVKKNPERVFAIYSLTECERDWRDYAEQLKHGGSGRRPRKYVDDRDAMVNTLAGIDHKIAFGDAVSTGEAAKILCVHWTFPQRLALRGEIVGRVLANDRNGRSRCWIFSRASCELNAAQARRKQMAGKKIGHPRKWGEEIQIPVSYRGKEGRRRLKQAHYSRERNTPVTRAKKRLVFAQTGTLACEVCTFQFVNRYGHRGHMFAECHHREPLASTDEEREVTLDDLAIVCANCHRMLHRRPEVTVEQLRALLEKTKADQST